uniref:Chemokine interleukin-8-like domain-containing protein n=1 Tax=Anabas testudineus TaxID=64144 RepID=A0A7N6BZ75_ANATE
INLFLFLLNIVSTGSCCYKLFPKKIPKAAIMSITKTPRRCLEKAFVYVLTGKRSLHVCMFPAATPVHPYRTVFMCSHVTNQIFMICLYC